MNILLINHFPLEGSESGTYTKNLAMLLVARGHKVCVILPENNPDYARYEGIKLHPVMFTPAAGPAPSGALPFNFPCFTTHPASATTFGSLNSEQLEAYLGAFREALAQEMESFAPDVVHGQHLWMLSGLAAAYEVPLVVTAHGTDLMGYDKWLALRDYANQAAQACKKIICISKDNEDLVLKAFPAQAGKVVRMSNGYNPAIFYPQDINPAEELARYGVPYKGERIVLMAGKLTHFKGVDVLLDAAVHYGKGGAVSGLAPASGAAPTSGMAPVITLIAGDGALRAELEEQAQRLGLDQVYFLGNVSQEDLCRLYSCANVDVVPSRREPFGLVAVEAMACGTPVVVTNEGGLSDFVNESVGALVPVEDAPALAQAIDEVLARVQANPAWRQFIAGYASSSYSQAAIIEELEDLYRSVL